MQLIIWTLFPSRLGGPGTVGALIQLAEENGLRVADVKTLLGRKQQVGEHTYHALSVHFQLDGTLDALRAFLGKLESGALQAARVDELSITGIEKLPPASPQLPLDRPSTAEAQYSLTASLDFSVYARD